MLKFRRGTGRAMLIASAIAAAAIATGCATDRGHWYGGAEGGPSTR